MSSANAASLVLLGYLFSASTLFPGHVAAQTPTAAAIEQTSAPSAGVIPELVEPRVECLLDHPKNFVGKQSGQSTDGLLSVQFANCTAKVLPDATTTVTIDVLVELAQSGNVQFCNSFSVAMLFEVSSDTKNFSWPAERILVSDLDIENVYGDRKSLGLFGLHSKPTSSPVELSTLFGSLKDGVPRFDNLFWGRANILQKNSQSEFARNLRDKLPIAASETAGDYSVNLKVRAFQPRGICTFKGTEANSPSNEEIVIFSPKTQ